VSNEKSTSIKEREGIHAFEGLLLKTARIEAHIEKGGTRISWDGELLLQKLNTAIIACP
jgi:hypothetical protein